MSWLAPVVLMLLWQFPRAYEPAPSAFTVSYTNTEGQTIDAMTTPPSSAAACARFPGADGDTYCTQWPTCPAPGVIVFWVEAVWGEQTSARTNLVTCYFAPEKPCVCQGQDVAEGGKVDTAAAGAIPSLTLPGAPGATVLQEALAFLAQIPPPQPVQISIPPIPAFSPILPPAPT